MCTPSWTEYRDRRPNASRRRVLYLRAAAAATISTRPTNFSSRAKSRFCASNCAASARSNMRARSRPSADPRSAIAIARSFTSRTEESATSRRARTNWFRSTGECPISSPRFNQALAEMRDRLTDRRFPQLRPSHRSVHQRDRSAGQRARDRPSGGASPFTNGASRQWRSNTRPRSASSASARDRSSR